MKLTLLNYQDIHILGIGNLGKYVAHALAKSPGRAPGSLPIPSGTYPRGRAPDPTTTLLFHRDGLARDWRKARERVGRLSYNGAHLATNYAHGLQYVDLSLPKPESHQRPETVTRPIRNLIVATKAHATVAALKAIGRRLNANSRILFLQNGMGRYCLLP
jgi:2-dehydropantoate 2-reductase